MPALSSSFHLRLCPPYTVHLKFSSISSFPRQCHVAIRVHYMPKSKGVHCYWPVAKQRMPATLPAPTRCPCSRIRSIRSYYADFSISEGIPEGRQATGRYSTKTCILHAQEFETNVSVVVQLNWHTALLCEVFLEKPIIAEDPPLSRSNALVHSLELLHAVRILILNLSFTLHE
jgi:hypothetical protein